MSPTHVNGAFPIGHYGCTIYAWLVVTGPEAGNMWLEDRGADNGLSPFSSQHCERLTFYEWYREWLDEAIGKLNSQG